MRIHHTALAALAVATMAGVCRAEPAEGTPNAGGGNTAAPDAATKAAADAAAKEAAEKAAAAETSKPKGKGKAVVIVWAAAGHPDFAPGVFLRAEETMADALRGQGKARLANEGEVKALKGREIPDFG